MSRPENRGDYYYLSNNSLNDTTSPVVTVPSSSRRNGLGKTNECITQIDPVVLTQRWTINNFKALLKLSQPGTCLRSVMFKDLSMPHASWQLCLYPGGKREENANHVSLFLKMSASSPEKEVLVKAEYRFHFLDENNEPRFSNVNVGEFHAKPPKGGHSWGLRNIPRNKIEQSIRKDDSLLISCSIELCPDVSKIIPKKVQHSSTSVTEMLDVARIHVEDEMEMLVSGDLSDMCIEVREGPNEPVVSFGCHRYKLAAHSHVFKAMLTHSMEENQSGKLTVSDFPAQAVKIMLDFIYMGTITTEINLEEAASVMQLADKYDIAALKTMCEQKLIERLVHNHICDYGNVVDCLQLAETHVAEHLKEHCLNMMASNRQRVMECDAFIELKSRNPRLTNLVLERMIHLDLSSPPIKKPRGNAILPKFEGIYDRNDSLRFRIGNIDSGN